MYLSQYGNKSILLFHLQCRKRTFLKEEIKTFYPQLRFAFSAPGFLTFKVMEPCPWTLPQYLLAILASMSPRTKEEMEKLLNQVKKSFRQRDGLLPGIPLSRFNFTTQNIPCPKTLPPAPI